MDDGAGFTSLEMEDEFIVYRMVFCCPFCTYVSPSEENVHSHAVSQHALQPTFRCPLCQEKLTGTANLRGHLGHGHNVVSECVEKLLQVAQKVEISFRTRILPLRVREELEQPVSETQSSREATHLGTEASPPESPCDEDPVGASEPVGDPEKQSGDTSCPLCRHTSESPQDLRTHFEKDHPELSPSDIQQACEGRSHETEGGEAGDRKCSQEITPVHSQQAIFRKTTNFAMDKFLDPSRPHKCVVCKESFTQKNILLVHYNSVSHLHKVRKASLDPSLSTRQEAGTGSSGHGVQTGQDKPYKCTVCNVSYNQSSTLEIHMRSVLHQTRSRGTKQDLTRVPTEKTQRDSGCKNETTNDLKGEPTGDLQGVEVAKKRHPQIGPCLGVPILPAAVASPSMQLSLDLPHPPPLVQPPQLFAPSLLSSFPLIPETLLKLQRQQQQLLLPFYLQELKVGGDGGTTPLVSFAQQPQPTKDNEGQQSVTLKPANEKDEKIPDEQEAATAETDLPQNSESKEDSPPKGPGDLTGSAARALLENFGFELVTQYNEGRQPSSCTSQPQPQPPAPPADVPPTPTSAEKLQCGTCGKLFSNRLILKTHEEHMHQRFLPFEALSRYAAHYRRSYDNHYPTGLTIETEESPLVPLDFSATSKCSQEMEEHDASCEWGVTVEQLSFLRSLLDLPSHATEEQILWAADKTGLSSAAVWQWYTQHEKGIQEGQEDDVEEPSRTDRSGNRRFSRTKFSDFQTQALNSFFESSAYPRDSEVEHLSTLLGLPGRVVVVWFQNARQKARKQAAETGNSPSSPLHSNQPGERPASNSKVPPCKKCGVNLPCIFQLIRHLKGCYSDQSNDITKEEGKEETGKTTQGEGSLPDKTTSQEHPTANTQEKKEEEQAEVKEKGETGTGDSKASAELPTINEEKVQILEKNNRPRPLDHNESSALLTSSEQNQNKPASNSSNLASPLVDLSLLISLGSGDGSCQRKRKHEEESLSPTGSEGGDEPPRDKRLRTTILPEQLDILHRWYLQDSNPTRSTLERISLEVGLKKRVVQVWFQNTRARERKGQYRGVASSTVSATRQQDEADGTKREVPPSYYYSVGPGQGAANVPAKTGQTISPMLAKTQASSGPTVNAVPSKSLINTTQAISGLLNAAKVLPSLANSSQSIPGLGNSNQALTSLVSTPQALSGLVNPAQVLSGLVNTTQATPNLLLATFTAKPTAPPILLTAATDVKPSPPPGQLVSLSVEKVVDPDKASASAALTKTPASEPQSCHQATEHQSLENQGGSTQKIPEDKGTPKTIDAQMHSPQTGDISDDSYSDPGPPSPGKSGFSLEGPMGSSGARRYRTQMSSLQLRILKACYSEYRTPSMQECECLGGEIGLQKRVVQVWFQNARAKEKKARLQGLGGTASTTEGPQPTECTHCNIKYGPTTPCRAHIFSRQHIARLRMSIQQQLKEESRYRDTHPAGGSAPPASENKQPSQILSFQAPNTVTTPIQRLTPLLMPGQGIPAPIGGLATFNAGPPPSLLGMASSVTPALLPRTAPTAPSSSHSSNDASMDSAQPAVTSDTSGPSPLKAAPLMGTPFMPFPLAPTATPLFTPQIQGPYFQQLYGLKKRLFPINPVIPHTLLGLLPAPVKPMAEAAPTRKMECTQTKATNECDVGLGEIQMGKEDSVEREDGPDDEDIPMVDVAMRYQCQRCKATYDEEGEAEAHQCESCYTGPPPHPPPLRLRVCTYHCLSCQVLLQGPTARSQHLRSQQHRAQSMCGDGASTAIPQLRPKSTATSVLMAL